MSVHIYTQYSNVIINYITCVCYMHFYGLYIRDGEGAGCKPRALRPKAGSSAPSLRRRRAARPGKDGTGRVGVLDDWAGRAEAFGVQSRRSSPDPGLVPGGGGSRCPAVQ